MATYPVNVIKGHMPSPVYTSDGTVSVDAGAPALNAVQAMIAEECRSLAEQTIAGWSAIAYVFFDRRVFTTPVMRASTLLEDAVLSVSDKSRDPASWVVLISAVLLRVTRRLDGLKDIVRADVDQAIDDECRALANLLVEKNKAYGNSALDPVRIFSKASPEEQILVRIDDKLSRVARGHAAGEDVEKDLLGYLILLRVCHRMKTEGSVNG